MSHMGVMVAVAVMMLAAAQEPGTCNVYSQTETGNRDRLGKMDCDGCKEAVDGFVGDEQCDHRQHNGAGEAGEIAELAGAKREVWITGALAGISVSECREQERASMRAHMQTIGDQCDRAKQ